MSTETQNSQKSGDSRRRRSRGGQNRRNNNNSENRSSEGRQTDGRQSEGRQSNGRQSGGGRREGGRTSNTGSTGTTGRQQDTGKPQRRPMPAPVQLSWWQKLLKAIGLYKEPVRPPRPERRPDVTEPKKTREPRQQKTRDARSETREPRSDTREARPETREPRSETREPRSETREPRSDNREERSRHSDSSEGERRGKRRDRNSAGPRGGDPSTVENRRVYVGNLSYDTTESDLEELFKGVGAVRRVEIVYNRTTHRSKGYGFIEMIDIDEAKRTVEVLHDQFFMGRQLTVSGAKSQDHQDAENEEGSNDRATNVIPPLAPINPPKEQVLDLLDEPKVAEPIAEPIAEAIPEEPHAEIPTEEFHSEEETAAETKEQPNA
jgi:RNA recognition motif-containing protein